MLSSSVSASAKSGSSTTSYSSTSSQTRSRISLRLIVGMPATIPTSMWPASSARRSRLETSPSPSSAKSSTGSLTARRAPSPGCLRPPAASTYPERRRVGGPLAVRPLSAGEADFFGPTIWGNAANPRGRRAAGSMAPYRAPRSARRMWGYPQVTGRDPRSASSLAQQSSEVASEQWD
jgi:hypothetical protein